MLKERKKERKKARKGIVMKEVSSERESKTIAVQLVRYK